MAKDESIKPFIFYSNKLNFKSVEGKAGKEYWVEGYISTGDMDLVNDIVTKTCMESMMGQFDQRTIKLDYEHEAFQGKSILETEAAKTRLPLGKAIQKYRDEKGVSIKWKMNPNWKKFDKQGNVTMTFKELWDNVENGFLDAFSIAYIPTRVKNIQQGEKTIRMLDDINLLNVALTGNPINPAATMSSVMAKSLEFMKSQDEMPNYDPEAVEIKSRLQAVEKELSELKSKSSLSDQQVDKNTMGCKSMTDENKESQPDAQAPAPEEQGTEAKGMDKKPEESEDNKEDEGKEKPEGKSAEFTELKSELKSLMEEIKGLRKENADLKAIVEKPQHKSKGAEQKEVKGQESNMIGPLDVI